MSVIRSSQYPGRWNTPDADAPQGSGKNRTAPGSNDGSYFDQVWFNDMDSLHQALFIASGVSPNGTQDVGTASQIFDALINNRWSNIGNYSSGTIVVGSDGNQYKCVSDNGRDTTVVDPVTASDRNNWVRFPYIDGVYSQGVYRLFHDDVIEVWGISPFTDSFGIASVSLPFAMNGTNYRVQLTAGSSSSSPNSSNSTATRERDFDTTTAFALRMVQVDGSPSVNNSCDFYVRGQI